MPVALSAACGHPLYRSSSVKLRFHLSLKFGATVPYAFVNRHATFMFASYLYIACCFVRYCLLSGITIDSDWHVQLNASQHLTNTRNPFRANRQWISSVSLMRVSTYILTVKSEIWTRQYSATDKWAARGVTPSNIVDLQNKTEQFGLRCHAEPFFLTAFNLPWNDVPLFCQMLAHS